MFEWLKSLSPEEFLVLNALLVTLIGIYMYSGRKGSNRPSKLSMKSGGAASQGSFPEAASNASTSPAGNATEAVRAQPVDAGAGGTRSKQLNVIFVFNQHSFDAHEVLGIPAGSSVDSAKAAYDAMIQSQPENRHSLLDAALKAIQEAQ